MTPRQFREAVERRLLVEREAALTVRAVSTDLCSVPLGRALHERTAAERNRDARSRTASRARRITTLRAAGMTVAETCGELGITERQFYFALRSARRATQLEATP